MYLSIEEKLLADYIENSQDEIPFSEWQENNSEGFTVILTEGFEERSLGVLERLANNGLSISKVFLGRYFPENENNKRFRDRFESAADAVSNGQWEILQNHNDGRWVEAALSKATTDLVMLDVTGLSNRAFFSALNACRKSEHEILIAYTEASKYWPKKRDWELLKTQLEGDKIIADLIEEKPWLFGYHTRVELIEGHEGFDSANSNRALIAFLHFKHSRLASIILENDYSEFLFIAGKPRLKENDWRLGAQLEINELILKGRRVEVLETFGYRNALRKLTDWFFTDDSIFLRNDIHLALLGSKLQTFACWVLCCIIPSITAVTSVPQEYFPEAFSESIGVSWIFPFEKL
jgi:hypothetical protein